MSCQQLTMRKLLNQKYEQYVPNLNPFSNILFTQNWTWPQVHIPQTLGTKNKITGPKTSSIKLDVTNWFLSLSHDEKCAVTMIKNPRFLYNFLQIYHQWNPAQLYHIYQHRKIPNYISKNCDTQTMKYILDNFKLAWLDQPLMYFDMDFLQSQLFFQKFINWMNTVSNQKIFEYAHKIKNKLQPQENLLWFTDKSFQSLQAWLCNQFQKVLIKNYYNKNNYDLDYYGKMKKLRSGLANSQNNLFQNKKQLQSLLCAKISQTKNKSQADYKQFQQKVKMFEDQYYEQLSLLLDFQKNQQNKEKTEENGKKKKKKSKKKNKKKQSEAKTQVQTDKNLQNIDGEQKLTENKQQEQITQNQNQIIQQNKNEINQNQNQVPCSLIKQDRTDHENLFTNFSNNQNVYNSDNKNVQIKHEKQANNEIKIQIKQIKKIQNQNSESGNSDDWSNVQTTKTTKKSGHSHPQFNQFQRQKQLKKNKRSLSPQQNKKSISKLKRKNRGQKRNKINAISSWNGDESINNQNFVQSYQGNQSSPQRQQTQQKSYKQQSQKVTSKTKQQNLQSYQQIQKKKKKKTSKSATLLKQLASKVSTTLLNRQVNNFIDSLSIQTNNLIDLKIVSFQRIRFFVHNLFPTSQPVLFGSNAVGLSLPTSDIDIMLFNLPCSCSCTNQYNGLDSFMFNLPKCKSTINKLQIDPTIQYVKTKRKCDYLILDTRAIQNLQLTSKKDPKQPKNPSQNKQNQSSNNIIKVDLTINITEQGFLGSQSTQLMKLWMSRYPQIHMCILAFKYILAQRGFSSNFKGGIGSYCLFVMVAAYIREYPQLQNLEDGEFFLSTLKFYGEDFQNQLKSIFLRPFEEKDCTSTKQQKNQSCFVSLQQTVNYLRTQIPFQYQSQDSSSLLYTIQTNPLRIFDPINNRIMSGSCHLYPQIKSQFRRIYRQLLQLKQLAQKQVQLTVTPTEVPKMLENKKTMDKWLNKYESRNRICIKDVLNGGF